MVERPRHLGRVPLVPAPPESTPRAEGTPTTAETLDGQPRYLAHFGYLFGGLGHPEGERQTCAKHSNRVPSGGVASVMCPVAFSIQAERKPVAAKELSDVAVSAASPLLLPRQTPPLGRTKVTSAKKLSEALRRQRRRCVYPQRNSPNRRRKTDARTSTKRSRLFCGVPTATFPPELSTHEGRTRRGPKICTSASLAELPRLFFQRK